MKKDKSKDKSKDKDKPKKHNNMAKKAIADLKARFKKGMYPTEDDFANVLDSYVHKDDGIDIDDVTAEFGSKTLSTLLQELKQEILQEAEAQETGYDDSELRGIAATNAADIRILRDEQTALGGNIAVHEARIQALEIRPEMPPELAELIVKVNSFLEGIDASDATINKWQEIEAFLSGITDTETLTGLLADLKEEILGEIPEQKEYTAGEGIEISEDGVISVKEDENKLECVKVIADLDASDAPKGTIAIYSGATNEKYTHGFVYEKTGEGDGGDLDFGNCVGHLYSHISYQSSRSSFDYELCEPMETKDVDYFGTNIKAYKYKVEGMENSYTYIMVVYNKEYGSTQICFEHDDNSGSINDVDNHYTLTGERIVSSTSWTPLNVMNVIG